MPQEYEVPRRLGEYQLRRLIGRGGMGEVWLSAHGELGTPCVIKVLLPKYCRDPEYRRRFFREAEILAMLGHGRIVPIIAYGECDGWLYIVMGYIDGVDLGTFCRALTAEGVMMPVNVAAYIIGEVLEGLRHAHERAPGGERCGVIHRDITPGNVMVSSEGEIFLTDFGLARREAEFSSEVFGTIEYMAPEQARGCACFQSDLYGVGGLLFFMLTGRAPRRAKNVAQLLANLDIADCDTGRDDVAEPVQRLMELCLAASLEERIATAHDGILLLDKWPGYRKETTVTAALYSNFIGPRKTGLTDIHLVAKESPSSPPSPVIKGKTVRADLAAPVVTLRVPTPEPTARLEELGAPGGTLRVAPAADSPASDPSEPDAPEDDSYESSDAVLWRPWWDESEEEDGADLEQSVTRRYLPPIEAVEPDAPRVFRRPWRGYVAPVDGEPIVPSAASDTEQLPPSFFESDSDGEVAHREDETSPSRSGAEPAERVMSESGAGGRPPRAESRSGLGTTKPLLWAALLLGLGLVAGVLTKAHDAEYGASAGTMVGPATEAARARIPSQVTPAVEAGTPP